MQYIISNAELFRNLKNIKPVVWDILFELDKQNKNALDALSKATLPNPQNMQLFLPT